MITMLLAAIIVSNCNAGGTFVVFLRNANDGKTLAIEVATDAKVSDVSHALSLHESQETGLTRGITANSIKISYGGQELGRDASLAEAGISAECVLDYEVRFVELKVNHECCSVPLDHQDVMSVIVSQLRRHEDVARISTGSVIQFRFAREDTEDPEDPKSIVVNGTVGIVDCRMDVHYDAGKKVDVIKVEDVGEVCFIDGPATWGNLVPAQDVLYVYHVVGKRPDTREMTQIFESTSQGDVEIIEVDVIVPESFTLSFYPKTLRRLS